MNAKSMVNKVKLEIGQKQLTILMKKNAWCFRPISFSRRGKGMFRNFSIGSDRFQLTNSGSTRGVQIIIWILRWCSLELQ